MALKGATQMVYYYRKGVSSCVKVYALRRRVRKLEAMLKHEVEVSAGLRMENLKLKCANAKYEMKLQTKPKRYKARGSSHWHQEEDEERDKQITQAAATNTNTQSKEATAYEVAELKPDDNMCLREDIKTGMQDFLKSIGPLVVYGFHEQDKSFREFEVYSRCKEKHGMSNISNRIHIFMKTLEGCIAIKILYYEIDQQHHFSAMIGIRGEREGTLLAEPQCIKKDRFNRHREPSEIIHASTISKKFDMDGFHPCVEVQFVKMLQSLSNNCDEAKLMRSRKILYRLNISQNKKGCQFGMPRQFLKETVYSAKRDGAEGQICSCKEFKETNNGSQQVLTPGHEILNKETSVLQITKKNPVRSLSMANRMEATYMKLDSSSEELPRKHTADAKIMPGSHQLTRYYELKTQEEGAFARTKLNAVESSSSSNREAPLRVKMQFSRKHATCPSTKFKSITLLNSSKRVSPVFNADALKFNKTSEDNEEVPEDGNTANSEKPVFNKRFYATFLAVEWPRCNSGSKENCKIASKGSDRLRGIAPRYLSYLDPHGKKNKYKWT